MTKTLTIELGEDWAGGVDSLAELINGVKNMKVGDIDRDHFAISTTTPIIIQTTAPASPTTGLAWYSPSTGRLSFYNSGGWSSELTVSGSAPTTGSPGQIWYDTTLKLFRIYETRNGLTGWHPERVGYDLMQNKSSSTIQANRVVVDDNANSGATFTWTNIVKFRQIAGVTLEESDDGDNVVVARPGCPDEIEVYVMGATHASVSNGDLLVTYGDPTGATTPLAGQARTVGGNPAQSVISLESHRSIGTPYGAFAEALEVQTEDGNVKARMLPAIGDGCRIMIDPTSLGLHTQSGVGTSSWTEYSIASNLKDTEHSPVLHARFEADLSGGPGASSLAFIQISLDQASNIRVLELGGDQVSYSCSYELFPVDDSTSAPPNGPGEKFSLRINQTSGSGAASIETFLTEYTY